MTARLHQRPNTRWKGLLLLCSQYVHTQAYTYTRVIDRTQIKQIGTSATNQASLGVTAHCDHHRAEQTNERLSKKQLFRKHTQAHTYG